MTDIKEPINTTSDGTFLSVVCENPEKSVVDQKLGGTPPPPPAPQELPPCNAVKQQDFLQIATVVLLLPRLVPRCVILRTNRARCTLYRKILVYLMSKVFLECAVVELVFKFDEKSYCECLKR